MRESQGVNPIGKVLVLYNTPLKPSSISFFSNQTYVQDLLWKHGSRVYKFITSEKGSVYICGSIAMVKDVEKTMGNILKQFGGMSGQEVKNYMDQLKV